MNGVVLSDGLLAEGVYADLAEDVARAIELAGIAILVVGGLWTIYQAARNALAGRPAYDATRRSFGRALLLALEVLVAADVVQTVAVDLTLQSVATLGLLVLVRTVLSFSLSAELEGVLPWRRVEVELLRAAARAESGSPAKPPPSTAPPDGR